MYITLQQSDLQVTFEVLAVDLTTSIEDVIVRAASAVYWTVSIEDELVEAASAVDLNSPIEDVLVRAASAAILTTSLEDVIVRAESWEVVVGAFFAFGAVTPLIIETIPRVSIRAERALTVEAESTESSIFSCL
jgi:hypothetical protein